MFSTHIHSYMKKYRKRWVNFIHMISHTKKWVKRDIILSHMKLHTWKLMSIMSYFIHEISYMKCPVLSIIFHTWNFICEKITCLVHHFLCTCIVINMVSYMPELHLIALIFHIGADHEAGGASLYTCTGIEENPFSKVIWCRDILWRHMTSWHHAVTSHDVMLWCHDVILWRTWHHTMLLQWEYTLAVHNVSVVVVYNVGPVKPHS